jgi:hypothetical protein
MSIENILQKTEGEPDFQIEFSKLWPILKFHAGMGSNDDQERSTFLADYQEYETLDGQEDVSTVDFSLKKYS